MLVLCLHRTITGWLQCWGWCTVVERLQSGSQKIIFISLACSDLNPLKGILPCKDFFFGQGMIQWMSFNLLGFWVFFLFIELMILVSWHFWRIQAESEKTVKSFIYKKKKLQQLNISVNFTLDDNWITKAQLLQQKLSHEIQIKVVPEYLPNAPHSIWIGFNRSIHNTSANLLRNLQNENI